MLGDLLHADTHLLRQLEQDQRQSASLSLYAPAGCSVDLIRAELDRAWHGGRVSVLRPVIMHIAGEMADLVLPRHSAHPAFACFVEIAGGAFDDVWVSLPARCPLTASHGTALDLLPMSSAIERAEAEAAIQTIGGAAPHAPRYICRSQLTAQPRSARSLFAAETLQ